MGKRGKYHFSCLSCGSEFGENERLLSCPKCSGKLDVRIDLGMIRLTREKLRSRRETDPLIRYFDFYPLTYKKGLVDVGMNRTPLIDGTDSLSRFCGSRIILKNEMMNPTGTFKIRPLSVGFNYGLEKWKRPRTFTIASCGNAADALASLAARGKEKLVIFVPEDAMASRIAPLILKGASVFRVKRKPGELGDPTYKLMREGAAKHGWIPVPSSGLDNCAQIEGGKSISFEAIEQMDFKVPDHVVVQVGGGGLLNGVMKGFMEFRELGLINRLPKIHAVQGEGCAPLVATWKRFNDKKPKNLNAARELLSRDAALMTAWNGPRGIAEGILDDITYDYQYCIEGLFRTNGTALTVTDGEIINAQGMIAKTTGLFSCPTGSVGVAGARKLRSLGVIKGNEKTLVILTGSGYKQLSSIESGAERATVVSDFKEVENEKLSG